MPATFDDLVDFQYNITKLNLGRKIKVHGIPSKSQRFLFHFSLNEIRSKAVTIEWWKLIWFLTAITKNSFIYWLALKYRLSTLEGLVKWGYSGEYLLV